MLPTDRMKDQNAVNLSGIETLLHTQKWLRSLAATVQVFWIILAVHLLCLGPISLVSIRNPLSAKFLILIAISYVPYLFLPLFFAYFFHHKNQSIKNIAHDLDKANPNAPDIFRTSLSLSNHTPSTVAALNKIVQAYFLKLKYPKYVIARPLHLLAVLMGVIVLIVSAVYSHNSAEFFKRSTVPLLVLNRLPLLKIEWVNPKRVVGIGDTLALKGNVRHHEVGQLIYAYVQVREKVTRFPITINPNKQFDFKYGPVEQDVIVSVAGENGKSDALKITAMASPYFSLQQAIVVHPAYMHSSGHSYADTLPSGMLQFSVYPGSKIIWNLKPSRPIQKLIYKTQSLDTPNPVHDSISMGPETFSELKTGKITQFSQMIKSPIQFHFWMQDEYGIESQGSFPGHIQITPDLFPEVDIVLPAEDVVLDRGAKVNLVLRVKDDFQITSLKLIYYANTKGKKGRPEFRECNDWLKLVSSGIINVDWDVSAFNLTEEKNLEFYFEVTDNDVINGPKTGKSQTRYVRMPSLDEVFAASRESEKNAESKLKSALQHQKQLEKKLTKENQKASEGGPAMLSDYEINRIMVDEPLDHERRLETTLAQIEQSLAQKNPTTPNKSSEKNSMLDIKALQNHIKDFQATLKKNDSVMPRGNQNFLPTEERKKNLEGLMKSQKEQSEKLAKLKEKLEHSKVISHNLESAKPRLAELSKELKRNMENQNDLKKVFEEQSAQAKAKSDLMDQAIEEQMRSAQEMQQASTELQKNMEQNSKHNLLSPELLEKMKKIDELMNEVLTDSLRDLMQKKISGQEVNQEELNKKLQEMMGKQAELAESLNRALAMLEQLKDQKRLQELKHVLGDLKKRELALEKSLQTEQATASQNAEQKSIQQNFQKSLSDFSNQAAKKKSFTSLSKALDPSAAEKDMQAVRDALSQPSKSNAAASAAKSASSAADKLGEMSQLLSEAMAAMDNSLDVGEVQDLLQESLALSRLQLLIQTGIDQRKKEGWEKEEAALYGNITQTSQWLNDRIKILAAKIPFIGSGMLSSARNLVSTSREASRQYNGDLATQSLLHNQNLTRELLKLLKMAKSNSGQGSGAGTSAGSSSGEGSEKPGGSGQGEGEGEGDLSSQLSGMSGKQMAINQATYQLLRSMLEGRKNAGATAGEQQGSGTEGSGAKNGGQEKGQNSSSAESGSGTLPGLANQQGELGEKLEALAEKISAEGSGAQAIRALADQARTLEEAMRRGQISPEEIQKKQNQFQTRLLESASALQERGQSEKRESKTAQGNTLPLGQNSIISDTKLIQLLREARKDSKGLSLDDADRKYLDEYYDALLTR